MKLYSFKFTNTWVKTLYFGSLLWGGLIFFPENSSAVHKLKYVCMAANVPGVVWCQWAVFPVILISAQKLPLQPQLHLLSPKPEASESPLK